MRINLAHTSPTIFESSPDLGLFLLSFAIGWLTLRYGIRIGRASLSEEVDYRSFLKLFSVCLFGGLAALGRFALIFYEWARTSEIFCWDSQLPLYATTQFGVYWIYVTVGISAFGVAVGFFCLNLGAIEKSALGALMIRLRWWLAVFAALVLVCFGSYKGVVRPMINRDSLLREFESTLGIDAYRNPVEVRLYRVYDEGPNNWGRYRVNDDPEDEARRRRREESWEKIAENYRGFQFPKETELLEPDSLKAKLNELYFYSSGQESTRPTYCLIRFVGETSVLDLWLGEFGKADIFTNVRMSDVPDALQFSRPYFDVMEPSVGRGLKYHAFGEEVLELWLKRLDRLEK